MTTVISERHRQRTFSLPLCQYFVAAGLCSYKEWEEDWTEMSDKLIQKKTTWNILFLLLPVRKKQPLGSAYAPHKHQKSLCQNFLVSCNPTSVTRLFAKKFPPFSLLSLHCKLPVELIQFVVDPGYSQQSKEQWKVMDIEQLGTFHNAFTVALSETLQRTEWEHEEICQGTSV